MVSIVSPSAQFWLRLLASVLLLTPAAAKPPENSVYFSRSRGCPAPRPETYKPPLLVLEDHGDFEQKFIREPIMLDSSGFATRRAKEEMIEKYGQTYSETIFLRHFKTNCFSRIQRPGFTYFELPIIYVFEKPEETPLTPPLVTHFLPYYILDEAAALTLLSNFAADLQIDTKGYVKKITPLKRWRSDKKIIKQIFEKIKKSHGDSPLFTPAKLNGKLIESTVRLHWGIPEEDEDEIERLSEAATKVKLSDDYSKLSLKIPESIEFQGSASLSAMVWNDGLGRVQGGYFMLGDSHRDALYSALSEQIFRWQLLEYSPTFVSTYEFVYDSETRQLNVVNIKYNDLQQAVPIKTPFLDLPFVRSKGTFKMIITISEQGKVSHVEFLETPHKVLNKFIVKGMKEWVFAPATDQGRPIESYIKLELPVDLAGPDLDAMDRSLRLP